MQPTSSSEGERSFLPCREGEDPLADEEHLDDIGLGIGVDAPSQDHVQLESTLLPLPYSPRRLSPRPPHRPLVRPALVMMMFMMVDCPNLTFPLHLLVATQPEKGALHLGSMNTR
ncbi:unnamed protein product [Linum trigynum]|uniref:Uncharacterized protein n=1 Tax=Linum trigynum TaxID=586398 RepID=A0AAV2CHP5_9ROSI